MPVGNILALDDEVPAPVDVVYKGPSIVRLHVMPVVVAAGPHDRVEEEQYIARWISPLLLGPDDHVVLLRIVEGGQELGQRCGPVQPVRGAKVIVSHDEDPGGGYVGFLGVVGQVGLVEDGIGAHPDTLVPVLVDEADGDGDVVVERYRGDDYLGDVPRYVGAVYHLKPGYNILLVPVPIVVDQRAYRDDITHRRSVLADVDGLHRYVMDRLILRVDLQGNVLDVVRRILAQEEVRIQNRIDLVDRRLGERPGRRRCLRVAIDDGRDVGDSEKVASIGQGRSVVEVNHGVEGILRPIVLDGGDHGNPHPGLRGRRIKSQLIDAQSQHQGLEVVHPPQRRLAQLLELAHVRHGLLVGWVGPEDPIHYEPSPPPRRADQALVVPCRRKADRLRLVQNEPKCVGLRINIVDHDPGVWPLNPERRVLGDRVGPGCGGVQLPPGQVVDAEPVVEGFIYVRRESDPVGDALVHCDLGLNAHLPLDLVELDVQIPAQR